MLNFDTVSSTLMINVPCFFVLLLVGWERLYGLAAKFRSGKADRFWIHFLMAASECPVKFQLQIWACSEIGVDIGIYFLK